MIVFLFLSIISIILGLFSFFSLSNSVFFFLLISAIVPNGIQFYELISLNGLYFLDIYFIFLSLHYILDLLKFKINKQFFLIMSTFLFLLSYLIPRLIDSTPIDKYLLRDFRPFITLVETAILFFICYDRKIKFSDTRIFILLNSVFISKILVFLLIIIFPIFWEDESYRYFDGGGYIAISYFLIYLTIKDKSLIFKNKTYSSITIVLALLTILVSTSRTIIFSLLLTLFLLSKVNIFIKIFISSFSFLAVYYLAFILEIKRMQSTFDTSMLSFYILERFYPAIEHIRNMNYYQLIFGKGIGVTFEIPWFGYREGIDPVLNNIDSTYFTFYVKYGIFALFIIFIYIISIIRLLPSLKTKFAFILVILIMYITFALPYQIFTFYLITFTNIISLHIFFSNKKINTYSDNKLEK